MLSYANIMDSVSPLGHLSYPQYITLNDNAMQMVFFNLYIFSIRMPFNTIVSNLNDS